MQQLDTQRSAFISAALDAHYAAPESSSNSSAKPAAAAATDAAFTSLQARAQRYGQWLQEERRRATRVYELQCEANWCRAVTAQDERGRTALMYAAGSVKSSSTSSSTAAGAGSSDDTVLATLLQVRDSASLVLYRAMHCCAASGNIIKHACTTISCLCLASAAAAKSQLDSTRGLNA